MATFAQLQIARSEGSLSAQRLRRRLGLSFDRRVDVFGAIESEGIWLMFQPLDKLHGFYRRTREASGIVINSNHPASLQRYTAAHELGHHVLGHGFSIDELRNIDGARGVAEADDLEGSLAARSGLDLGDPAEEAAAQAFAATFLMPIQAVNSALAERDLDIDRPSLDAPVVYELSLDFGTSYAATVTQLAALQKVPWSATRELQRSPLAIKTELTGRELEDARSDVWLVDERDRPSRLAMRVGDEIVFRLREVPSSGYAWSVSAGSGITTELVGEDSLIEERDANVLGAETVRRIILRVAEPGIGRVEAALRRPWERDAPRTLLVRVEVAGEPTGDAPFGLLERQKLRRAGAA